MNSLRLFIAVELPPTVHENLAQLQAELERSLPAGTVRWVDPWGAHLTLKFLGQVAESQVDALRGALEQASATTPAHHLHLEGLGCFPRPERPRVLWVGLDGNTATLKALQAAVDSSTEALGFASEKRPYHPHVTVGRVREPDRALVRLLTEPPGAHLGRVHAREVHLMQSHLSPQGARHESLGAFPLRGSA